MHLSGHDQEFLLHVIDEYFDPRGPDCGEENGTGMCSVG